MTLCRLSAPGMADFARVNAHRPRWSAFPGLRESELKRFCLSCWVKDKRKCIDTEWHAVFDCKVCSAPRNRFRLAFRSLPQGAVTFQSSHTRGRITLAADLALLVTQIRTNEGLVNDFARFVVDINSCRQRAFKKMSVRDLLPPS